MATKQEVLWVPVVVVKETARRRGLLVLLGEARRRSDERRRLGAVMASAEMGRATGVKV